MDHAFERLHNLAVFASELEEGLGLGLEDVGNGLNGVACYQLPVERMVDQFCPCLLPVVLQGNVEERSKPRCARVIAHIMN